MKWFKHMTDAHDNNDLTKVRMRYGAEGYAVYWYCLELVAGDLGTNDKITFELRHDAEVIGHNLKIDSTKVEEIMRFMVNLGLFEQSGGIVTCLKLAKYLDKKSTRNETIHSIIDAASNLSRTVPDLSGTSPDKAGLSPLDIDIDTDTDKNKNTRASTDALTTRFATFWLAYPKKRSRGTAEKAWKRIKPDEQLHDRIMHALDRAKTSADWLKDDGQFIPYPATWLNGKGWEDELSTQAVARQKEFPR